MGKAGEKEKDDGADEEIAIRGNRLFLAWACREPNDEDIAVKKVIRSSRTSSGEGERCKASRRYRSSRTTVTDEAFINHTSNRSVQADTPYNHTSCKRNHSLPRVSPVLSRSNPITQMYCPYHERKSQLSSNNRRSAQREHQHRLTPPTSIKRILTFRINHQQPSSPPSP